MGLQQVNEQYWRMHPGPLDVHAHPRVFDAITPDNFVPENDGTEGKAGLAVYTSVALRSGITAMLAMPNESRRVYDLTSPELTVVEQTPIADLVLVQKMQDFISQDARTPVGVHFGINPEQSFSNSDKTVINEPLLSRRFFEVRDECTSLKVYLAETTGGNNVGVEHGARISKLWHEINPEKPVVFHVEGEDVARLLNDIKRNGDKDFPVHIAHVSSRVEMQAILDAKVDGMNVTCEVTPHHMFLDESARGIIGGFGCMKPSLKSQADIDFLWAHIKDIDMFASDCAPHRKSDKQAQNPAFGVTNHTTMLPLLLGAVADGKLSMDDLYEKLCINPRTRFNLPLGDGSSVDISTAINHSIERYEKADYGFSPFGKLGTRFHLVGEIVTATGGNSTYSITHGEKYLTTSRTHLIRPKNIGILALHNQEV